MNIRKIYIINKTTIFALMLVIISFIIYMNSVYGLFFFDDSIAIIKNHAIKKLWPLWKFLYWEPNKPTSGRPIFTMTLAINYSIGKLNPLGYHIVNILIHTICGILLFFVLKHTLKQKTIPLKIQKQSEVIAFLSSLIWIIHPLQTECVNYITQRNASLVAMFYLASIYCSIKAYSCIKTKKWYIFSILYCILGNFTKETIVTLPLIIILYDFTFFYKSIKQMLYERKYFYLGLFSTWIIFAMIMATNPQGKTIGTNLHITSWQYLVSQSSILTKYLKLIFVPHPLNIDYGYAFQANFFDYTGTFIFMGILVFISILIYIKSKISGFAGLWFFIIIGPTSSIIPLVNQVGAERRMYLPSMAIIALLTVISYNICDYLKRKGCPKKVIQYGMISVLAFVVVTLGELTILRNSDYHNHIKMWKTSIIANDSNTRSYNALGLHMLKINKLDAGIECLEKSIQVGQTNKKAYANLALALAKKKNYKQSLKYYLIALTIDPDDKNLQNQICTILIKLGRKIDSKKISQGSIKVQGNMDKILEKISKKHKKQHHKK